MLGVPSSAGAEIADPSAPDDEMERLRMTVERLRMTVERLRMTMERLRMTG